MCHQNVSSKWHLGSITEQLHSTLHTSAVATLPYSGIFTLHCTLYTVHYTLYTVHCTLYTVYSTLYTLYLYTLHSTIYTLHSNLYTLHSIWSCDLRANERPQKKNTKRGQTDRVADRHRDLWKNRPKGRFFENLVYSVVYGELH